VPTYTFFGTADPPAFGAPATGDNTSYTLGLAFEPLVAGNAVGVRFYWPKEPGATMAWPVKVGIWNRESGALLAEGATATAVEPAASGWIEASFPAPPALEPGSVYVVGYLHQRLTGNPAYWASQHFFESESVIVAGVMVAPKSSGVAGGNARFHISPELSMPDETFGESNYGVDVVFEVAGEEELETHTRASSVSGGGGPESAGTKVARGASAISAGGASESSAAKTARASSSIGGGGGVEVGTSKVASRASEATAGGRAASAGAKLARHDASVAGGGGVTSTFGTAVVVRFPSSVSGGGAAATSGSKRARRASGTSGGGSGAATTTTRRFAVSMVSGGGLVVSLFVSATPPVGHGLPQWERERIRHEIETLRIPEEELASIRKEMI
jgi:hypothetical protein